MNKNSTPLAEDEYKEEVEIKCTIDFVMGEVRRQIGIFHDRGLLPIEVIHSPGTEQILIRFGNERKC